MWESKKIYQPTAREQTRMSEVESTLHLHIIMAASTILHAAVSFPTLFLIFIIELSYAAAPLAHTISDPLISDLVRETVPARLPRRTPVRGGARSTEA
mgnify:CR=1 FL=1